MQIIKISVREDFSPTPGPRYIHEGKKSGEAFRKEVLYTKVSEAIEKKISFEVNLDGTAGYGTSFLEESFGGLIRANKLEYQDIVKYMILISKEEEYLKEDVREYLNDAYEETKK